MADVISHKSDRVGAGFLGGRENLTSMQAANTHFCRLVPNDDSDEVYGRLKDWPRKPRA